jgi:peroxiredoxin
LARKYASRETSKVAVVALSVSTEPDDRLDRMKERARAKGFNFPYLFDGSQKIGRQLGATVTPEIFVLDKERKIIYMGAFDDSLSVAKVTRKYLEEALDAALAGKPIPSVETRPVGCSIEYQKK